MSNHRVEERRLKEIKQSLIEKYEYLPDGDLRAAHEFELYIEMWRSNIPLKYWENEISDLTDSRVSESLTKYVEKMDQAINNGVGLYMYGTQGTGKTLSACLVLKEAIRHGYRVYFTMLTEVFEKYCDGRYDKEARSAFQYSILDADFLVVDDIDKGYTSDKSTFIDSAYDYVFRTRANKNLPIIITSNMKRDKFSSQENLAFGKSLLSIFDEHLVDVLIEGRDRRKEIQERLREFLI
jgi:DNA replication protein DnaC